MKNNRNKLEDGESRNRRYFLLPVMVLSGLATLPLLLWLILDTGEWSSGLLTLDLTIVMAILILLILLHRSTDSKLEQIIASVEEEIKEPPRPDPPVPPEPPNPLAPPTVPPPPDPRSWKDDAYHVVLAAWRANVSEASQILQSRRQRIPAPGREQAQVLKSLVDETLIYLEPQPTETLSVKSLSGMAHQLEALLGKAPEKDVDEGTAPKKPSEWQGNDLSYLQHLNEIVTRTTTRLVNLKEAPLAGDRIEWSGQAAALLQFTSMREDPNLRQIQSKLLALLGWVVLKVEIGDPVDRTIHNIEAYRATAKLAPNRVLEILKPGFRDQKTNEVVQLATVVISEQMM